MASIRALLLDELGYEPESLREARDRRGEGTEPRWREPRLPSVAEAAGALPPAEVAAAERHGERVAVVRTASGRLFVLPDRCPHDGGPISDGFVDGESIVCARHGWEIDPCSGACQRAAIAS